jgi:hypothetical protein
MGSFAERNTASYEEFAQNATEDEVAEFIESMLNELSLLAAGRIQSQDIKERIAGKIMLFETYFARKRPRILC